MSTEENSKDGHFVSQNSRKIQKFEEPDTAEGWGFSMRVTTKGLESLPKK